MSAYNNYINLGELFGLKQQPYGDPSGPMVQHSTNDPLIVGSGSVGYNITDLWNHFPNTMTLLKGTTSQYLNWNDTDVLNSTYPWFCMMEAGFMAQGGIDGGGFQNREPIYIPQGMWYFNREIRVGQNPIIGSGQGWNFGTGGTVLNLLSTNWKSMYGAQNDGIRALMVPFVYRGEQDLSGGTKLAPYGMDEWSHFLRLENLRFNGTATLQGFWSPGDPVETGVIFHNPGEGSGPMACSFNNFRGFGYLVSGTPAPFAADSNEIFYNQIAGIGIRGGANSKMSFNRISGDNNPWMLFVYKSGSDCLRLGQPFLPCTTGGSPGGNISFTNAKIEAMCWRQGYPGFSAPGNPALLAGKGGMWARLTGRFQFLADSCTLNVHNGRIFTAIEVLDDDNMNWVYPGQGFGTLPLDNSRVEIRNAQMKGVKNYLADWFRQRVVPIGDPFADHYAPTVSWSNYHDSGNTFRHGVPNNVVIPTSPAAWRGTQPIINSGQPLLDWAPAVAPAFNYNIITGADF